jgi:spore germination cell wall hydrolase CwlJ-like protein
VTYDDNDLASLALCSWREARGEIPKVGILGPQAVCHVCVNRVGVPGFAPTLHQVIYGRNQFTSMSVPSDAEYRLFPANDDDDYLQILGVARHVLDGDVDDPTHGAVYYANLAHEDPQGWFQRNIVEKPTAHPVTAVIGGHSFFA